MAAPDVPADRDAALEEAAGAAEAGPPAAPDVSVARLVVPPVSTEAWEVTLLTGALGAGEEALTDGTVAEGTVATGVETRGVVTEGVEIVGAGAEDDEAVGVVTEGVVTDGVVATGVVTDGTLTVGVVTGSSDAAPVSGWATSTPRTADPSPTTTLCFPMAPVTSAT
jgi:hypothetical protein